MQGQHSHGVAYYRCRFPQEYALANKIDHPRNVITREDVLIPGARLLVLKEAATAIPDAAVGEVTEAMLTLG